MSLQTIMCTLRDSACVNVRNKCSFWQLWEISLGISTANISHVCILFYFYSSEGFFLKPDIINNKEEWKKYSKTLEFDAETHTLIFILLFCCFRCQINYGLMTSP